MEHDQRTRFLRPTASQRSDAKLQTSRLFQKQASASLFPAMPEEQTTNRQRRDECLPVLHVRRRRGGHDDDLDPF